MDLKSNVNGAWLSTSKALPAPPFATGAPVFAASLSNAAAFAFTDPVGGGTLIATVDAAGAWNSPARLALSAVGMTACMNALVLGGLRLPDGELAVACVEQDALLWSVALPRSGRWIHGPFPACAGEEVYAVWVTLDDDKAMLWSARVTKGVLNSLASVELEAQPLEMDVTSDGDAPLAVWTGGARLGVSAARVTAGSLPVFQGLEGGASPRWMRTPDGGLAWIAVSPKGLRAQRISSELAPSGAQSELGEGFAPLLVTQGHGMAALLARGARAYAGTVTFPLSVPREERVYAAGAWIAELNTASLKLSRHAPLTSFGRYLAAAFTPDALLVIHGDATPQLTAFALA
ncbi:MAG: hypothetical protein JOZ52_14185 [Acidobacteria bacterium]|nr:hypothetical protein [Acidobacteriota bacterium]